MRITRSVICLLFSCALLGTPAVAVDSGMLFGPYIQRVTKTAATILIRTEAADTLTLHYRKAGGSWKTKTDSQDTTTHRFRIWSLDRGAQYEYYISTGSVRLTQTNDFRTRHEISEQDPLRIAAVGDMGDLNTDQMRVLAQLQAWDPTIALGLGDTAYDSGTLEQFRTAFFAPYQSLLADVPIYPAMGNHDFETDNGTPFKNVFELPTKRSGTEDYYAFSYDTVDVFVINSNLNWSAGSTQYNWLAGELGQSDAQWKIVTMHHPPFSSGYRGSTPGMDTSLVPLFEAHNVDLVLAGHDHDYERNDTVNGVLYVVSGGGGRPLRPQSTPNPYSLDFEEAFHFTGIVITDNTLKLKAIDKNGFVFDSVTLSK